MGPKRPTRPLDMAPFLEDEKTSQHPVWQFHLDSWNDTCVSRISKALLLLFTRLLALQLLALVSGRGDLVKSGLAWHQFHALLTWPILPATSEACL